MEKKGKYTAICTDCGNKAEFLYKPDKLRPVYCNPCGKKHKEEHFLKMIDYFEKTKQYGGAGIYCALEGKKDMARKYYQKAEEMYEKEKSSNKTIDNVITSILAFGGLGLIFTLFSKPYVTGQNIQLAPPFPNYLIYVFAVMLFGGAVYLTVERLRRLIKES